MLTFSWESFLAWRLLGFWHSFLFLVFYCGVVFFSACLKFISISFSGHQSLSVSFTTTFPFTIIFNLIFYCPWPTFEVIRWTLIKSSYLLISVKGNQLKNIYPYLNNHPEILRPWMVGENGSLAPMSTPGSYTRITEWCSSTPTESQCLSRHPRPRSSSPVDLNITNIILKSLSLSTRCPVFKYWPLTLYHRIYDTVIYIYAALFSFTFAFFILLWHYLGATLPSYNVFTLYVSFSPTNLICGHLLNVNKIIFLLIFVKGNQLKNPYPYLASSKYQNVNI